MIRALALVIALFAGSFASATTLTDTLARMGAQIVTHEVDSMVFDWKKGDRANYNLNLGSFIKGSMQMNVMDVVADGVWIQQLLDLGFAGKQDVQQLIDPNTGEIKKYIVNGKEQAPPSGGETEIIETKEDTVRVPAGTFTCLYVKAKVKAQGQESIAQQWVNPKAVPVMGLVKMVAESQMGPVTAELLSFTRM